MLDKSKACPGAVFHFTQDDKSASLTTAALKVEFSLNDRNLTYSDLQGRSLLREVAANRARMRRRR
jgi:hypothetical protein